MKLCFATNNQHKLTEIRQLLGDLYEIVSLDDIGCREELREDFETLEENSRQKAKYVIDNYGADCFADDSGLEVDALGGRPGVYSARFAGPQRNSLDNISKLLAELANHKNTSARFRAIITLITKAGEIQFEGIVEGRIIDELRGEGGFGYDPVFVPEGYTQTFAEMDDAEKNRISHRGRAVQKLIAYLQSNK